MSELNEKRSQVIDVSLALRKARIEKSQPVAGARNMEGRHLAKSLRIEPGEGRKLINGTDF